MARQLVEEATGIMNYRNLQTLLNILTVHVDIGSFVHHLITGSVDQGVVVEDVRLLREVEEAPVVLPDSQAVRPVTVQGHPIGGPAGQIQPGCVRETGGAQVNTVSWTGKDPLALYIDSHQGL